MDRAAPVTRLSLAFAAGAAWALVGAPSELAPLVAILFLAVPKEASGRPGWRLWWVLAGGAGLSAALAAGGGAEACLPATTGRLEVLEGRFLATPRTGSAPFFSDQGCGPFTVVTEELAASAGVPVRLRGIWRDGRRRPWFFADSLEVSEGVDDGPLSALRWSSVRWRDGLVSRLERLYGERGPLVAALTLARREGLDPELRESFARVGIAHLLAISGFHVGVIAGVLLGLLRLLRVEARRAAFGAAAGAWAYVGFIGFPDAAFRAALILTAAALYRLRGRPSAKWGAIGTSFLLLLALDPRRLTSPGFQLSFAGAAGLVAWSGPVSGWLRRRGGRYCPRGLAVGLAAGVAATIATLPIVAWHFERVSLVGIPATLTAAPLVTLSLIGSLLSLLVDFVSPELASVLAGGASTALEGLEWLATTAGSRPWTSAWTTRGTVIGALAGVSVARLIAGRPRIGATARRTLTVVYGGVGVLVWPLLLTLEGRSSVELLMIDVGQGDAIALRSPRGRWILVDTGPPSRVGDAAGHPVVRALRSRGVRRLEAVVLTHPDLDHIGGAVAVLESFEVGAVYDPGMSAGKEAFVDVLEAASRREVPWRAARAGHRVELDGLSVLVLHPVEGLEPGGEANASSVVLHVTLGGFDALLTGDAYKEVDRLLAPGFTDVVEVLKVGHHGSDTSTDPLLLGTARPEIALVSVGRSNRYGHPSPEVIERLERSGARVHRTDLDGSISVRGRADGSYSVALRR